MTIIDGKFFANGIFEKLKSEIAELVKENITVGLAIVLVGDNPASQVYVSAKIAKAKELGIGAQLISMPAATAEKALLDKIEQLNIDAAIDGIVVQLPLPAHIDKHAVQSKILPTKDVDGFHPVNVGLLHTGSKTGFIPGTPLGCLHLIKSCCDNLSGKNAVVIGRSDIVGKPMAALLLNENCTVTICHSHTENLHEITKKADIIVAATGMGRSLGPEYFNKSAIVIDVGITRLASSELVGDVDYENVKDHVAHITPVPGGVGPMTIAYLLSNTVKAAQLRHPGRSVA